MESAYPNCHVTLDHKAIGRRSGVERQVDVWITEFVGTHQMSIAVSASATKAVSESRTSRRSIVS